MGFGFVVRLGELAAVARLEVGDAARLAPQPLLLHPHVLGRTPTHTHAHAHAHAGMHRGTPELETEAGRPELEQLEHEQHGTVLLGCRLVHGVCAPPLR